MGPRREGEQMDSYPGDFPFGIMDVVELLHLRIRRRQANSVYVDCPFCGDRRGKMNVNFVKNVWRCNYCDEHGGMLALYARLNNTTTSDAYWEIGEALCNDFHRERPNSGYEMAGNQQAGTGSPVSGTQTDLAGYERRGELKTVQQAERASGQEIHQTLSLLLAMLPLQPAHRNHLHSPKRGLSDEQIDRIGFKSTPPPFLCRSITERLMKQTQTVPFAFKRLDALHKAGYEQPPAAAYQTVWSAEVCCPKGQNDMEVLGRLFLDFNEHLPEDYRGRPLAPSDVVELDCQGKRTYFYVNDCRDFAPVRFSPFLCKRLPEPAQKQE